MTFLAQSLPAKQNAETLKSFERLEELSPDLRRCAHEYGMPIVAACLSAGVREPRRIHALVREIWDGARQRDQKNEARKYRCAIQDTLDWLLVQSESKITAETLVRLLWEHSLIIVPLEPTNAMIDASTNTVSGFDVKVTKSEKHRRRLRAALQASTAKLWPYLMKEKEPKIHFVGGAKP